MMKTKVGVLVEAMLRFETQAIQVTGHDGSSVSVVATQKQLYQQIVHSSPRLEAIRRGPIG